jgi:hypothetical protein
MTIAVEKNELLASREQRDAQERVNTLYHEDVELIRGEMEQRLLIVATCLCPHFLFARLLNPLPPEVFHPLEMDYASALNSIGQKV